MGYSTFWTGQIYANKDTDAPFTGEALKTAIRDIALTNKTFDDGWLGIFVEKLPNKRYVGFVDIYPDDPDNEEEIYEQEEPRKYTPFDDIVKWSENSPYKFFVHGDGEEQGDVTKTWICGGVVKEQIARTTWSEVPTF